LDDLGLYLSTKASAIARKFGVFLIAFTPYMMKTLTILGTAAMFLVGGGIIVHGEPHLHHIDETLNPIVSLLFAAAVGLAVGAVVLAVVTLTQKFKSK
jgi:predicted DNA repair protein MutK